MERPGNMPFDSEDGNVGGYLSLEECIAGGFHLECVDEDGFCTGCGYQSQDDYFDELEGLTS